MQRSTLPTELSTEYTIVRSSQPMVNSHRQSHFAPAFFFLTSERRKALEILYEVCRVLDDAVDVGQASPQEYLNAWKKVFSEGKSELLIPFGHRELAEKFLEVAASYKIPMSVMLDLIEKGVEVDLTQNRFETPMDTERYCYGVAGTVGLACLPIFGVPLELHQHFAIRLGIAIQWINIIRDVGIDAKMGRIYLPLEHLQLFGYTEQDLFNERTSSNFLDLMAYEAKVARSHYRRAMDLFPNEWKKQLRPARIMGQIYFDLLSKCERSHFSVFNKKIRLHFFEKMMSVWRVITE